MSEDFKWTDELVKEYVNRTFAPCDPNHQFMLERMAEFKKSKQPKPLFTTEDGKKIFEGDTYHAVSPDEFYIIEDTLNVGDFYKRFASLQKAKEYVIENIPCLSFKDICGLWIIDHNARNKLKDLIKSKKNV